LKRAIALVYSKHAEVAGAHGSAPSHYAPGERSGARMVAGVTGDLGEPPIVQDGFCSEMTRHGAPCKARPVAGSTLCIGHTRQKAAS